MSKKNLFICLTDFQILNTLSIIKCGGKTLQGKSDILLVTNKPGNAELAQRLVATKLFDKVFLFDNARIKGLHIYFRNSVEGKPHNTFLEAVGNSIKEVLYKVRKKTSGMDYALNAKLILGDSMDFSSYKEVFCLDKRQLVVDFVQQILHHTEQKAHINLLDEGTSTYWRSILTKNFPITNIYLTVPALANYYNEGWQDRIQKISSIPVDDDEFRNLINYVWSFTDDQQYDKNSDGLCVVSDSIIFFDQNWDPLPEYFAKLNKVMKLLLHNSYKKHKKESVFYDRKMAMFRLLSQYSDNNKVVVKLHPRSPLFFVKDYQKSPCVMAPSLTIPWEVFMDNCIFKNNIWVTVSSTALCTYKMAFADRNEDVPMIFLYKIVYKGNMDFHEDDLFFQHFKEQYPKTVFIPETIDEFIEVYKKLVSEMNKNK